MANRDWFRGALVGVLVVSVTLAQNPVYPPGMAPRPLPPAPQPVPQQVPAQQAQPAQGQRVPAQQAPAPGQPPAQAAPAAQPPAGPATVYGGMTMNNASLTEVIDLLARQLHINYILDPRVKGGVILNTYGEVKNIDPRNLLDAILRINGFGMVQQGELYRIVPLNEISHQPLHPESVTNPKNIPEDDRTMLNLIFLKFVAAEDLVKVLTPFEGENAQMYTFAPANLLLVLDSRRNMRRLMELVALFDNDTLANNRVRLFETKNGRPSDLVKELDSIVKSISLNEKTSPIKFLPVDRINTIIAVASNPGAFAEVEKWLAKLDIPVKAGKGGIENYVYRVKYGNAVALAMGIMMLYGGNPTALMGMMSMMGMMGGMMGGGMMGGMNGMNGMNSGMGMGMMGMGGMNPYAMSGGMNPYGGGYGAYGGAPMATSPFAAPAVTQTPAGATPSTTAGAAPGTYDQTGQYLGYNQYGGMGNPRAPRVIPNPFSNTLMIQATPQDYEQILKILRDMDLPPRQVLIDAKIYEIDLGNSLATSVGLTLQDNGMSSKDSAAHHLISSLAGASGAVNVTDGFLVGRTKELLSAVQVLEGETKAKIISAPSVIATDSIPANINVGTEVPTLTAQAVTGAQQNGNSLFANTISNVSTGVTLNITAQVNPSGIVTMMINQDVSAPQPNTTSNISSPQFSKRTVQTQVTVQDGDTIAIGGIITEQNTFTTSGIPYLNHLPVLGALFGNRNYSKSRTELVIFMTPHVIYDTNQIQEASQQLQDNLRHLRKMVKEQ